MQKRYFVNWFLNEQLHLATTQDICTATGITKIKGKVSSPITFFQDFAEVVNQTASSQRDDRSFENLALENATKYFNNELEAVGDVAAAEFICKIMVNRYDPCFKELAASGATLADFLRTSVGDGEESSSPPAAYAAYKKTLQAAPVSSTHVDTGEVYDIIPGDEESEERSKLFNQIIGKRRERCAFHYPPVNSNDIFRKGGPVTQMFQDSKFF